MTLTDEELITAISGTSLALHALREEGQRRAMAEANRRLESFTEKVHQHFGRPLNVKVATSGYDYDVFYAIEIPATFDFDVASNLDRTFMDVPGVLDFLVGSVFYSLEFKK